MLNSVKMDLKDLCRLCLSRGRQLMWVFDDSLEFTTHAKKLILSTVGVEINKDDVISQKICSKCGENVLKLYTFREQSLKNDKLLKELHRNVRKKTMHKSVIDLFKKYPGLKIPNVALDLNISPMVVMDMDGVQNYLRAHNINMAKHTQEVLRNESTKASCSSKDSSVSTKDTVSPISLKLVQNTSSYEIIHKTNTTEDDGRLQQEIINLLSSPVAKRISSYGKRRNSLPDVSPPHKRLCEASTSHQSISRRRRSHSNSKSEHLNNKKKVDVNKSPVIISNILIHTSEERDKTLSNGAKQSNQTAGTHEDPEIQKSNQREKLDSSIYTNINGIKPLSSTIVIDKTLCNDRQIISNLQLKKTSETHDSQIPKSDSLNRSEGATEHQVPIVDSTCPNSPPEILHNIALSSSDISEKSVTECNFKENAMTNLIGTRKKPTDVVSDRDACNKLDFNRDFSPKKLKITEPESQIEISSPQIIEVDLSSEDETSEDLSISFNTKNNLNNTHICTFCTKKCETKQDLLAHSSSCVPKNNATADSSRALEKQSEVTKNPNSNVDTRNGNSTEVVPEIIEIVSDDEEQATSNITSSVIIPNITMPDNEFIDINSDSDRVIINQLLSAIKDLPCPEKETQTNISSHHLFDKLQEDFKIILNDESVTPNFEYRIKMQRFKAFLHLYKVPCIITNGKQFSIKYTKEQVQPKQELKYWDNLIPIDIKLKNSYVKLEPPEADDDQVLNSQEKISADGIEPQISHVDNVAVNVTNIPKVASETSLNPTLPTPVPLESFPPTLLAQVSAKSVEMARSSNNSINVCLPQSTEKQKTQEITLNDPGLEIDIDATIRLNTEELAKLLDISVPSSNCNNNSSNSAINSSHNLNVIPPIEANLRNVPLPTPFPTFSNENVPVVLPSTTYPSLPELGLNIENFDSYMTPVVSQNLPIHTNSFIDSNTSNSTSTRLPDVLSTIPRPPAESLGSQNIHLSCANNNILSNATELENIVRGMLNTNTNNTYNTDTVPSNTDVRRNNNFPNNPSNYQHYQQHINFNMNVYNNNSRQTPDITPRNAYYRSQGTWAPPEQTNGYSQTALPPPPPYSVQHHQNDPQQGFPSSYGTIPTISNNRNYNSNPPLNNYRQVNRPQSNNRNCYTPYPPNNSTNSVQRNSNNQNYGYFSQMMQSLPSMRNNAPRVPEPSNPSNIRVRPIDDLR